MSSREYHFGRILDHVHIRVSDLEVSKTFYRAVLQSLGHDLTMEGEGFFCSDELFVSDDGDPTEGLHFAFQTENPQGVRQFYEAGLKAGGVDNGPPGDRHYHPGYFSAYLLDPDGNNIEAVYHGPARRSVQSVVITPAD